MFLVSYEFTFDVGMQLLLLLLQHRQQDLVAQRCEKWCCMHRLAQRSSRYASQTPRMVKIKRSIKYRHLQFLTGALLALHMRRIIIFGIALKIDKGGDQKHTILLQWP